MPAYTSDQLAAHLRSRGARVITYRGRDTAGCTQIVTARNGNRCITAVFKGHPGAGRFQYGLASQVTGPGLRAVTGKHRSLKATIDTLGLPIGWLPVLQEMVARQETRIAILQDQNAQLRAAGHASTALLAEVMQERDTMRRRAEAAEAPLNTAAGLQRQESSRP